ncbi:hypothetical protein KXX16_008895 [Aspergillus fumigatus]|nr:hypothetical protein KXX64_005681 [Aspergillus fumigatus]KAH1648185.1 hypothetical protein KXX16_008895 [Aspergillus fumigatus]KAH1843018.1 hypothetical protein KXX54_001114 [Aspergillus fumigatus]KAH2392326.1 hypothetical protein KXW92_008765 [Aspergillus fumigatus]KAH2524162.1 hypothetical protein KXW40_000473 [Aspergillus fumigatus]
MTEPAAEHLVFILEKYFTRLQGDHFLSSAAKEARLTWMSGVPIETVNHDPVSTLNIAVAGMRWSSLHFDIDNLRDGCPVLYSTQYDGFCFVSSDSDFTRLAARIRESGPTVYGFGEHKTPRSFVAACDKFIYTENLMHIDELVPHANSVYAGENHPSALQTQNDSNLTSLLRATVEAVSDDDGWARLSKVGPLLTKKYPGFGPRTYGYHKLSDLTTASSFLESARRSLGKGLSTEIFVRDKRRKPKDPAK